MRDLDDLVVRLKAFGRDCVEHGDMTPSGEVALLSILERYEEPTVEELSDRWDKAVRGDIDLQEAHEAEEDVSACLCPSDLWVNGMLAHYGDCPQEGTMR